MTGRFFPTLSGYERALFRPDILAGLSAGAVVIPQAMAYATIAGMPVQVGLYTCMVPVIIYAALGGSRAMSLTTTSTIATLTASTLLAAGLAAGSVRDLATLTLLVGVILLAARVLHMASLVDNISGAVLTGVKFGVGLTVAAGQLPKLLGIGTSADGGFFRQVWSALRHLGSANLATVVLSAATIALLLLLARYAPRVPGQLVAVAGALILVPLLSLPSHGVDLIAPIPRGLPTPDLPPLRHIGALLPGAFAIALMALLETVAVARGIRQPDEPPMNADRELTAVAVASVGSAFFRGMPTAGGFSQSAVNSRAGARTQAAGLTMAVLAVLVALFLAPTLSKLPQATLGAMVLVAVLGLIQPAEFARLARISRVEFWLATLTAVVGLTAGLLAAVAVGVVGTLFLVLRELNHPSLTELRPDGQGRLRPAHDGDAPVDAMMVLRLDAPLYTANVRAAQRLVVERVTAADPRPAVVVVDAIAQGVVSVTVLDGIRELDHELTDLGATLWIADVQPRALAMARRTRWWPGWESSGRIWPSSEDAVDAFIRSRP
ncbi:MAG TPA: SulP family inorganic anion transporter [Micromonosporaceae bacterium]